MDGPLVAKIKEANTFFVAGEDAEALSRFFTPDYVAHLGDSDVIGGHTAIRRFLRTLRAAFSDVESEVEILVEGKDRVAWLRTVRAIHRGEYKGFPASGRRLVWRDMIASRFRDGLIAEDWVITDLAERLLLARKR